MTDNLPHTKSLIREAVLRSFLDPAYFLRFFLPHWFPSEIPAFHLGIIAIITGKVEFLDNYPAAHSFLLEHFRYQPDPAIPDAEPQPVFIATDAGISMVKPNPHFNLVVPRGFSKTTLVKGIYLYLLLTDNSTFAVLISATSGHAETQLGDIKMELQENALLREAYGNQVPKRSEPEKWSALEAHLLNGAILVARGRGGQVRGLTHQGKRPNRVCLDDVEDEDSIATANLRSKTSNWFYGSVVPAGQIMEGALGQDWAQAPLQIINLGTLLGAECLVMDLGRDRTFSTIRMGARIAPGLMLWPYKLPETRYEKMRSDFRYSGKLAAFTREYDSLIRVEEDALFPAIFHYVPVALSDLTQRSLVLDPAISEDRLADHSAIVVAGRHSSGRLWFLDEWGGVGKTPKECIEALFEHHLRWQTQLNGIEAVAYQAALLHLAKEEMARRQHFMIVTPIRHGSRQTKGDRIVGTLSPRYQNNFIAHLRPLPSLESNLADWPNGKKDYADAASMALNLLGETVGLVAPGGLADLPAYELESLPAGPPRSGNYYLTSGGGRMTPARNPRYG
jgi:hypothetical protein